jgi:hypothetical protein
LQFDAQPSSDGDVLLALNDIPTDDIRAYVEDNIEDFDTDLIAEFVDEKQIEDEELLPIEIEEDNTIAISEPINLDDLDENEILKYFDEEEIDIIDLMEDESFI